MDGHVEHAADVGVIDGTTMHADSDEATGELAHDHEHPVAPEHDGLASKQIKEEGPQSANQPVAQREVRRPLATTTKNDQLLLEYEILGDHGSHATGATQLPSHNGEVQQSDQEVLHARVSVGQRPGATQRCPILESARELAIRDAQAKASLVLGTAVDHRRPRQQCHSGGV
jgi:hypothetical protein